MAGPAGYIPSLPGLPTLVARRPRAPEPRSPLDPAPSSPGAAPPLTIRAIRTVPEYDACEELQRRAWGYRDIDVVPKNELISASKAGGVVLGAFAPAEAGAQGQ